MKIEHKYLKYDNNGKPTSYVVMLEDGEGSRVVSELPIDSEQLDEPTLIDRAMNDFRRRHFPTEASEERIIEVEARMNKVVSDGEAKIKELTDTLTLKLAEVDEAITQSFNERQQMQAAMFELAEMMGSVAGVTEISEN